MPHNPAAAEILHDLQPKDGVLRVMPLGGLGEIGMNCCLFEYNGDIIMVDCGQMMPDEEMLGIDYVIPDVSYLESRRDRLKAIVLTHGHEDHVGALPFILPKFDENLPVYGSEFTVALLKEKLKEHGLKPNFKQLVARQKVAIGKYFVVEPMAVTHSLIDSMALAISTPIGTAIHTGDFKIDPSPTDGVSFDFHAFSRYAEGDDQGVLLLMSDSTNADRSGTCPSEASVIPTLTRLIRDSPRQVIVSCFSSSLHRIQGIMNIAADCGRTVFPVGLNMERNIRVAESIDAIEINCQFSTNLDWMYSVPPQKRLIITTGSQGEPLSALSRMSTGSHKFVQVDKGDTVIISARMIPGNEKPIYRMINHLSRRGAHIHHTHNTPNVHVSGHAYRDEMKHVINLTNPKYFVPVHGEFRHLKSHAELAQETGMNRDEIVMLEDGDCLEVTDYYAKIIGKIPHGRIFVDGKGIGDVEEVVLRDRRYLSEDGVVMVILSVDRETGEVLGGPFIQARGFVAAEEGSGLLARATEVVLNAYRETAPEEKEESAIVQAAVKKALKNFIKQETRRFPVILPVIMEV